MHIEELIKILKNRRTELGVTLENLADLSGVGLRTIKGIESGKGNPTFGTLSRIADVLGMEIKLSIKQ